jgi:hypothetical protein
MSSLRFLAVLVSSLTLTACLNSTTLVKVKPDGSGTVEQTTLVNTSARGMMGGQGGPTGPMMNKADLERTAAQMGKGVRLVSNEPVKGEGGFEGVKAIFSFEDINQIQISQGPNMGGTGAGPRSDEPTNDDPVRFKLTRNGGTSTLSINFVDRPGASKSVDANVPGGVPSGMPDLTNPMIMNMLKSMFQGFKVNVGIEVVGAIVKTDAEYVTGPRVTLLELDAVSLLADEAKLKVLQGKLTPDLSLSEVKPYLKDMKGIKIDGPSISVEFR